MGERKGKEGKKVMNGLLAHPVSCENGLLSTLSGKGWTKRPFLGGSSSQCELLGHFGVILGPFGASTPRFCQVANLLGPTGMGP